MTLYIKTKAKKKRGCSVPARLTPEHEAQFWVLTCQSPTS